MWFTIDFADAIGVFKDNRIAADPEGQARERRAARTRGGPRRRRLVHGRARAAGLADLARRHGDLVRAVDTGRQARPARGSLRTARCGSRRVPRYSVTRLRTASSRAMRSARRASRRSASPSTPAGPCGGRCPGANRLVRISPDGEVAELEIRRTRAARRRRRGGCGTAPCGSSSSQANKIGRYADGRFTEFPAADTKAAGLTALAVAPDGAVWFGELRGPRLGRLRDGDDHGVSAPARGRAPIRRRRRWRAATSGTRTCSGGLGELSAERARGR